MKQLKKKSPLSSTQRWRLNNPLRYCYQTLKDNSKRRGIKFSLTLKQFEKFCTKTDYLTGKGKTKTSYSIDRIKSNKGYTLSNIQILTLSENSSKQKKILVFDEGQRKLTVKKIKPSEKSEDDPF